MSFLLGYNPISWELIINLDREFSPPLPVGLGELAVTYYDERTAIRFSMGPQGIDMALVPVRDREISLQHIPAGHLRWRLAIDQSRSTGPLA